MFLLNIIIKIMIPYHVFLMGNPLDSAEPKKAYAKCVTVDNVSHEQFVRNVAEYSGIHSRGNIKGVLSDCVERLVLHLVHGDRVTIDDLGTFSISLKCKGAATVASFSNKNIKEVNIVFTPCKKLKETLAAAEFKQTNRQ